ncbi:3-ketoacyl-ACP reductase [Xinfangfangia sp. CPCC 101601]|uniref:3-ketoacyl-ACP reductase n=1 Tax=Pseudogemmobacter lacusdianii TaxID=3069608 RepID=A0ABU0VTA7_9RHOB|nr:3-ketoacyl-ACP reductase [Xinfangfangia sp. CPCC 101601]MDQ2064955.1 3-ketoacyl-ACP reductase [Xinfangfangia sp. CPCC 101601]
MSQPPVAQKPLALITGGQQGIGLGIAQALQGAGFRIAVASLPEANAAAVREGMAGLGHEAQYYQYDMAQTSGAAALLAAVEASLGPISCFVANAGVPAKIRGDLLEITPEAWDHVLDVNLRGTFFLAQEVARRMVARQSRHYRSISFVTSASAEMVSIERGEYCISKSGASMMAKLFALRLAPLNIGVFELRPGIIATEMTAGVKEKYSARIEAGLVPAQRWGAPEDIGRAVVPLALGQMAFATGMVVPLDGGLSVPRL